MDKLFDLSALLRNNKKKHKSKPTQFVSVAGGVEKRLQSTLKNIKSNRLTVFDSIRNLPKCEGPLPAVSDAELKMAFRRQQLEKWKAEKDEKKKQEASKKKKPFIAGVVRAPLTFEPPPPPKPSTSGRVTRAQTRNTINIQNKTETSRTQSFAPKNATFKAPQIKTLDKLPTLALSTKAKKKKKTTITFEPVAPNPAVKLTRSKTQTRQTTTDIKNTQKPQIETRITRGNTYVNTKNDSKTSRFTENLQSSSSGSDIETSKIIKRVKTPRKTPNKTTKPFHNLPKALAFESTTDGTSSDNSSIEMFTLKSKYSVVSVNSSASESEKMNSEPDSSLIRESTDIERSGRKSVLKRISSAYSGSGNTSSDVEFVSESIWSAEESNPRKSLQRTPMTRVPQSKSNSEQKLQSLKSPTDLVLTPKQIECAKTSPCVTVSRGKDKARMEVKWKMQQGLLGGDASDIENVDHFRQLLSSEMKRITEMCNKWDAISEQTVLPDPVQEAVLAAVGQARLLMSQKMGQFASLVERCAKPEPGAALVTPADLHGFWDMVFMQVENVNMRFQKLEDLRSRNWAEETPQVQARKVTSNKPVVAKKAKIAASSSLKDMIAAKRKAIKQQKQLQEQSRAAELAGDARTFEGGFFLVRSPSRSPQPAPLTPNNKHTLLKAVLSSEANKSASKHSTPFAMLRASMFGKNIDCEGIAPLQQTPQMNLINFEATPGRSILKSSGQTYTKSIKKSVKVLFNDSNYESSESFTRGDNSKTSFQDAEHNENIDSTNFDNKENSCGRKSRRLIRQDAVESVEGVMSGVTTRSQRKSLSTPKIDEPKRSLRKKTQPENTPSTTTKKSHKKDGATPKSQKRSSKKLVLQELEDNEVKTPKRSTRRSKIQN